MTAGVSVCGRGRWLCQCYSVTVRIDRNHPRVATRSVTHPFFCLRRGWWFQPLSPGPFLEWSGELEWSGVEWSGEQVMFRVTFILDSRRGQLASSAC